MTVYCVIFVCVEQAVDIRGRVSSCVFGDWIKWFVLMYEAKSGKFSSPKFSIPEYLRRHCTDTQRYLIIWIITGICCGVATVAFHKAIEFVFHSVQELSFFLKHCRLCTQTIIFEGQPKVDFSERAE
jgi:succinate-acetate transporter protein